MFSPQSIINAANKKIKLHQSLVCHEKQLYNLAHMIHILKKFTIKIRNFRRLIHIIKIQFESLRLDYVELDSSQFNLALSFKLDRLVNTTCDSTSSKKHVSYMVTQVTTCLLKSVSLQLVVCRLAPSVWTTSYAFNLQKVAYLIST